MNDAVSPRQSAAFLLTALSAPAVTVTAGLPWPWVLAVSVLAAAVLLGLRVLQSAAEQPLAELTVLVWGRAGKFILFFTAVFCLLLLWRLTPLMSRIFPETADSPFVPVTLLALAAWASFRGRAAVLRAVAALSFFLAALYAAVFLFALPDADFSRLPAWREADLLPAGVLFLPTLGLFLARERSQKPPLALAFLTAALPAAVSALCAAVPGSRGSFYEMAKSVEVFGLARRIEPMVSALLTLGWFALCALPALCVGQMARACGLRGRWASLAFCLLAMPAAVAELKIPNGILLLLGTIFCVLFPLLTLLLGAKNFSQKNFKKDEKRC